MTLIDNDPNVSPLSGLKKKEEETPVSHFADGKQTAAPYAGLNGNGAGVNGMSTMPGYASTCRCEEPVVRLKWKSRWCLRELGENFTK